METDFSEFSYGYAAIREAEAEVARAYRLAGAPILPSLLLEEKLGYDVKIRTTVEYALFLQFKRPQFVKRRHPQSPTWPHVHGPHYRFTVDTSHHQYQLLCDLEAQIARGSMKGDVFYTAARFHTQAEFDQAYFDGRALRDSVIEPPSEFPNDGQVHYHVTNAATGATTVLPSPSVPSKQVEWSRFIDTMTGRAAEARFVQQDRLTLHELEEILLGLVVSAGVDSHRDLDAPVSQRIDRLATSLGCGLVMFGLDPGAGQPALQ